MNGDARALLALIILSDSDRPYKPRKRVLRDLAAREWIVVDGQGGFRFTNQGMAAAFEAAEAEVCK